MIAERHSVKLVETEAARILGCEVSEIERDPIPNIGSWIVKTVYHDGTYDYTAWFRNDEQRCAVEWYTTSQTAVGRLINRD